MRTLRCGWTHKDSACGETKCRTPLATVGELMRMNADKDGFSTDASEELRQSGYLAVAKGHQRVSIPSSVRRLPALVRSFAVVTIRRD